MPVDFPPPPPFGLQVIYMEKLRPDILGHPFRNKNANHDHTKAPNDHESRNINRNSVGVQRHLLTSKRLISNENTSTIKEERRYRNYTVYGDYSVRLFTGTVLFTQFEP